MTHTFKLSLFYVKKKKRKYKNKLHTFVPVMSDLTLKQIPVGDLHCQRDTYARTLTTECIACSEKPDKKGFYQVKLYDTSRNHFGCI
jgi:hypothetical protein